MDKPKVAIIFPAFNEENTIEKSILSFHKVLKSASIYVVDNNSSDNTKHIATETLESIPVETGVLYEAVSGKANAIRRAFRKVNADIFVMVDSDLTYSPDNLKTLINPIINKQYDLVVGDRLTGGAYDMQNRRRYHGFGNRLVRNLINMLFRSDLKDIMSGYRVMSKEFVKTFPIMSHGFELETEMTLHALDKRFSIKEIPIKYVDRPLDSLSKLNTIRDGFRIMKLIFVIFKNYRPFKFFGLFSALFFIFGLISSVPVFNDYITTKYVSHIPLAILATGLMTFSLLFLAVGLILATVVSNNRQNFELDLMRYK